MASTRRRPQQTRTRGVAWLQAHPDMLALGWMNTRVVKGVQSRIVNAMRRDGVIAPTTYAQDVRLVDWLKEAERT
jgi:hypothetical protein